jgi:sugar/nucleoside kinase (ribokinase family)
MIPIEMEVIKPAPNLSANQPPRGRITLAIAAARAEMDVRLIAAVGKDSAASLIRYMLRAERIATDTLIDLPSEPDYSVIIVARGGENMIITSASQAESVTGRDVDRRVSISSGDALLLQGNLLPDPTLHAAKRAKQAGAKVIFNAAPYRDWCKTMSHDVDVSDRSHENAALLKLFLIAPPPEKARDLFHSRERGLRAD